MTFKRIAEDRLQLIKIKLKSFNRFLNLIDLGVCRSNRSWNKTKRKKWKAKRHGRSFKNVFLIPSWSGKELLNGPLYEGARLFSFFIVLYSKPRYTSKRYYVYNALRLNLNINVNIDIKENVHNTSLNNTKHIKLLYHNRVRSNYRQE